MEPHASSKLPTFHQCQEVYEKFKVSIKNGENPLDESWELLVNAAVKKDHLRAWRKHEPETGLYKYQVWGEFTGVNVKEFFPFYKDYEYRASWDPYTAKLEQVDSHRGATDEESHVILKWRVKFGLPLISDREYLFKRADTTIDGVHVIQDTDYFMDAHPEKKSPVRVTGYNSYICLAQDGENTILYIVYATAIDLKMPLPTWLVNWAASSGVKNVVTSFRDSFEKYPRYLEKKSTEKK